MAVNYIAQLVLQLPPPPTCARAARHMLGHHLRQGQHVPAWCTRRAGMSEIIMIKATKAIILIAKKPLNPKYTPQECQKK